MGALIFGIGLGAMLATLVIITGLLLPEVKAHLNQTDTTNLVSPSQPLQPPTLTPTPLPTFTPVPTPPPSPTPLPAQLQLTGLIHQWQTWNNCGPATLTMAMSYFGSTQTQADAAPHLKPNRDDKNVGPDELAAYARAVGFDAKVRLGGSIDLLKRFINHNLPVIVETWQVYEGDGLGHYRLITGYDDATGQLNTYDSLNGPDFRVDYAQFDADWRVFNRLYIVIYPPASEQAGTAPAIIGADMEDAAMYARVLAQAQAEAEANPADAVAYFNQGEALARLGRFAEAAPAFDRARQLGLHWRRLWYQFTPFETYYAVGRYQDLLDLTAATLKSSGGLEEAYYYHGLALLALGQPGAKDDFQAALDYNPLFTPAAEALNQLETNPAPAQAP